MTSWVHFYLGSPSLHVIRTLSCFVQKVLPFSILYLVPKATTSWFVSVGKKGPKCRSSQQSLSLGAVLSVSESPFCSIPPPVWPVLGVTYFWHCQGPMLSWGKSSTIFLMVLEVSFPFASFQWICLDSFSSSDPLAYDCPHTFQSLQSLGVRFVFCIPQVVNLCL